MNEKEKYNEIVDAAYSNYLNNYSGNFELDKNEFVKASKNAPDFSEHWGLRFEKRELTYSERYKYWFTHNYETGMEYGEGEVPDFDNAYYEPTPTHAIMVSYNNESAEIYE